VAVESSGQGSSRYKRATGANTSDGSKASTVQEHARVHTIVYMSTAARPVGRLFLFPHHSLLLSLTDFFFEKSLSQSPHHTL
jgi:hypothetical protein